jgi:hypothetical protein
MASNRHLYGDTMPVQVVVPDCIRVEQGDLMVLAIETAAALSQVQKFSGGVASKSGATGYAYPMMAGSTVANETNPAYTGFIGVALDDSPKSAGTTDTISVATAGVFRFPVAGGVGGVTVGQLAQNSIAPALSNFDGTPTENYTVRVASTGGGGGASGCSIGYVVKTETGTPSNVDVQIRTLLGPGGIIIDA